MLAVAVAVSEFPRGLGLLACVGGRRRVGLVRRAAPRGRARRRAGRRRAGARRRRRAGRRGRLAARRSAGRRGARWWRWRPRAPRSPSTSTCPDAPAPPAPGALLQPALGRREGRAVQARRRGTRARDRAGRAQARATTSRRSSAPRWTAAPTGWRWPAATARRRSSRRSRPSTACRTRAFRRAPATTSRSTSASTATTSSARSTRSSTAASDASTWPRSTGACSSTTSRSGCTRKPSSARATATRSCARCSTPSRTCSAPSPASSTCDGRARRARAPLGRRGARLQQPLPARPRRRLGHAAADRRRPARHHRLRRSTGRGGTASCSALARVVGARFDVDADRPVPAGIDGEALVLEPPLRFRIRPGVLRVRIARQHPGASPSARRPRASGTGCAELARIAVGRHAQPQRQPRGGPEWT